MTPITRQALRFLIASVIIAAAVAVAPGCADTRSYLQSPQGAAVLVTSEGIANVAVSAAATIYGGPVAGQLASAGLNALGAVLQGYIDKPVPQSIVKASPGITAVGSAVAPLVSSQKPITQSDVDSVYQAASIAKQRK